MDVMFKELNDTNGMITNLYHEAALKQGMSDSEQKIFYALATYGEGCNQSLLYKKTGITRSTINTALKKMEKEDIVYLETGFGRNTRVCLTPKGREYLAKVEKLIEIENSIISSWPKEDQEKMMELNVRFANQLKDAIENM